MRREDIEPDVEIIPPKEKWYQRKGCMVFFVIMLLLLAGAGLFGWQVYKYYSAIKSGNYTPEMQAMLDSVVGSDESAVTVTKDDDPAQGNPDAKIVVIAFEDFQCPICGEAYPILKQVLPDYSDKVLFVYRDFPTGHEFSQSAAEAANCANEQGQFWAYHDLLFSDQAAITGSEIFSQYADQLGLDVDAFDECYMSGRYAAEVNKDFLDGNIAGVSGTPTFFINGYMLQGSYPVEFWRQSFDYLIEELYK
ncbi:MAG: thioredoxin domain-containing protein [Patescibacteria group bacterium]|jgi:protein-disulfide isomerase